MKGALLLLNVGLIKLFSLAVSYSMVVLYTVYIYRDHEGLGILAQKLSPQNQLDIYFLTLWEHWLGIAKPKNVFRSILNPSIK